MIQASTADDRSVVASRSMRKVTGMRPVDGSRI
jgi:hypothetical protein